MGIRQSKNCVRCGLRGIVVLLLMLCDSGMLVQAATTPNQDPLIEHLEFLGYECDLIEGGVRAKHFSKIHVYITSIQGGIRFQTGFPGNPVQEGEESRYRVTNGLMKQLAMTQLYWSADGNLFAMAWLPGIYEKTRFAVFMEAWDRDMSLLRGSYKELQPYLKEEGTAADKPT